MGSFLCESFNTKDDEHNAMSVMVPMGVAKEALNKSGNNLDNCLNVIIK